MPHCLKPYHYIWGLSITKSTGGAGTDILREYRRPAGKREVIRVGREEICPAGKVSGGGLTEFQLAFGHGFFSFGFRLLFLRRISAQLHTPV